MKKNKGFSFIEIMLSTVILLLLATLIIPNPKSKVKIGKEARLLEILNKTRRGLLNYNNDFAYFPKVGETYNYLNALYTAASIDPTLYVPDLPPEDWTLLTILENAMLDPQIPPQRWEFYPDEGKYRAPYLRGDGRTVADLLWHDDTSKGFYENPFTQSKYDWEVKLRKGYLGPHVYSLSADPSLPGPLLVCDTQEVTTFYVDTAEVHSGWYRINTRVYDPGTGQLYFPMDPDPANNTNESIEIMDIRFYPSNRIGLPGEKKYYMGLNGKYYYQW